VVDPTRQKADEIERGAVGPVRVFADDDGWLRSRPEGVEHAAEERLPLGAGNVGRGDLETERRRQIAQRTERTGRGERVAGGAQHGGRARGASAKRLD